MKRVKQIISFVLLSGLLMLAYDVYKKYTRYNNLVKKLPNLPAVHVSDSTPIIDFPEKIWAHKVNTIERALILSKEYKGLEMDVVFDTLSQSFDVRHPPDPSTGTSLDTMFSSIPGVSDHYFWLDFKNLEESNKQQAMAALKTLADKYKIRKHILVESTFPEALSLFTENGFYTSYYIPAFDLQTASSDELKGYYEEVKEKLFKSRVCALSSRSESFPFIEKYFPGMDMLLWHLDEKKNLSYQATLFMLIMKSEIKVVLVHVN